MTQRDDFSSVDLAIIGAGAAGVVTAIQAMRRAAASTRIALIDASALTGRGIAYATTRAEHLLNVPAARMSAFVDEPDDFLDWLRDRHPEGSRAQQAECFARRSHYGDYLQQRLDQAIAAHPGVLHRIPVDLAELQRCPDGTLQLRLDDGRVLQARGAVLAVGNSLRPLPGEGAGQLADGQLVQAWDYPAVQQIAPGASVCIVGTGLSMADSVLTLAANGHRGPIHLLSRHALLPLPHDHGAALTFDPQPLLAMTLRQRLHVLRGHARQAAGQGVPWQSVMDRIRPLGQALWQSLDASDQRRFLRHVVRYWDIHRHRIAEPVADALSRLQSTGQLDARRGRLRQVEQTPAGRVRLHACDAQGLVTLDVDVVINATGVETAAARLRSPLLRGLLEAGSARPGPHGLGLDTSADGHLLDAAGEVLPQVSVVGSLRIGTLWESLAMPELRGQAQQAAITQLHGTASAPPIA